MLKFPIYSIIWIFIILLLIFSAIKTNQHNIINNIDSSSYYYTYNHCYKQHCGQPKNKINNLSTYTANTLINPIYCYANDVYDFKSKSTLIDQKWKRRTLCAVRDDEKYPKQTLQDTNKKKAGKRTLEDYDEPIEDGTEDQDSLKTHIRVKRNKWDPRASSGYQQDYLKDLANSFPRNAYESIDENSYDDVSFDAKREIKSEEFSPSKENDRSKIIDAQPFVVSSSNQDDKSVGSNSINKINALEPSKDDNSFVNRRSTGNTDVEDPPEDPMLAVDLVRRKRNDLTKKSLFDSQSSEKNSNAKDRSERLSSLVDAKLKAHLFRLKRRAKNDRQKRNSKTKKKKNRKGKKQGKNSLKSTGNAKNTNKPRTLRERKSNGARSAGKSNVGIPKVVSKKNNKSNFHRRFVESKKSIERTNSKNDRASKNPALENNHNSELRSREESLETGSDADGELTAGSDDARLMQQQLQQMTKFREKRDKNSQASHGFLNKEDELRYYENIREPETYRYVGHDKRQRSVVNEAKGNRAVRSIEEVKELAKKLVTKVNDLQNFINVEESKANGREKRIGTRAIDALCSNVSTAYDAFKEPPKIIQKCVSSASDKLSSSPAKIIVERNIDPSKMRKEDKLTKTGKEGSTMEKKRSIVRPNGGVSKTTSRMIRRENEQGTRKWGRWTDWSSCSVTCGKGRQIRWRYCSRDCSNAETEMEEKSCQLPACPPGKFLGIF